ncbi:DegT/DnrJ/EryC1/StrS family aminotransferase [Candidatus Micrarchaeota archaeon]|nr:DegT/DnrJ/EryC1/StrS family aminotransferase [Candidatus Micrarchaeota archaeon]
MEDIPVTKPFFPEEDIRSLTEDFKAILKSGRLIQGPYSEKFERLLQESVGVKHVISVNTCTTALSICTNYFGAKNSEVIVPSATFIATPNSVLFSGGKPVFAEIKEDDLCLDPEDVSKKITKKTKAIITVHLVGSVSKRVTELKKLASDHKIPLIEDCAHAFGSTFDGLIPGSIGDAGCFSFYPTKTITTGLGGAITTNDEKLITFAKSLRNHGAGETLWEIVNLGNDWTLMEVNCALGIYQLKRLNEFVKIRQNIAQQYLAKLKGISGVNALSFTGNTNWNVYRFPVLLDKSINQQTFLKNLKTKYKIGATRIYIPCHLQPFYRSVFGHKTGELPITEDLMSRAICLPVFPQMTSAQVDYVCEALETEMASL